MATTTPAPEAATEAKPDSHGFPIVGIGASAGGLEAFTEFLENLSTNPGLAFLFVLHLQPDHKSELASILSNISPLPIQEAVEGVKVEVNHVYLIPPNANMALTDGSLALTPRSPVRGQHMPIDHLFRSLAEVRKAGAIGVILSGGGTDGTLGFQSIKAEGGITFAQEEQSAKHDSMPRSAIGDGNVDHILPPHEIARALLRIARHPYTREPAAPAEASGPDAEVGAQVGDAVGPLIELLRASTGVDFTHYKRSTVTRRIQRRMALLGLEHIEDYLRYLRGHTAEAQSLYQDLLIRVTQFFRDPRAFEALKEHVFPALVAGRSPSTPIRIWVAGCSTGEEVYSLAIALLEYLGGRPENPSIKILATDLNETALEKARTGLYIENIEIDVSAERLRRFFVRSNAHYQISKAVRDLCVFSRHNLASDPPFSHLDLISCRNVLIYMDVALQKRILPILHYALNPDGFLFLGGSENVSPFGELFRAVDPRLRLFVKKPAPHRIHPEFGAHPVAEDLFRLEGHGGKVAFWSALDVQKEADRVILAPYAPVGVVTDETLTVLQFRGRTAPYLEPAPGMASLDLLRMLREGLLAEVRGAVNRAKTENTTVSTAAVQVLDGSEMRRVRAEVIPFQVAPGGGRFFVILFREETEETAGRPAVAAPSLPAPATDIQVNQLHQELAALREYLQSVIEEHESTNEELKSANEEILSANEELQSTNEELQTAKEEAQSANEELATVNEELRHRNVELARVNNDLINLLGGVNIPIVMVGRDLRIRRFTPLAEKVFNLIATDVGRPISDIKSNLKVADLSRLIADVIDSLAPSDGEVQDKDGHWYALKIRPYITLENKIDGASVVLLDIDSVRRRLERLEPPGGGA